MSEETGVTTLVVELAAAPSTAPGQFAEALRTDLQPWIQDRTAFASCHSFVLSLRIPDADIDGFSENRGWSEAPDAMIQFEFSDSTTAKAAQQAGPAMLLPADALRAADPHRMSAFVADEHVVFETMTDAGRWNSADPSKAPVKMVVLNWKRTDLTFDQFTAHWSHTHAPLVTDHGPAMGFGRYVQSHRHFTPSAEATASDQALGWRESPDGGITEVWFPTQASMKRGLASAAGLEASAVFATDEVKFIYPARMSAFLAQETRVDLTR